MIKEIQLRITLKEEEIPDILVLKSAIKLDVDRKDISGIKIIRKSIDARKPKIILNYKVAVYIKEPLPENSAYQFDYKNVSKAKPIHIIGFGPAGMYAALRCIELGFKPVVLERGKNVQDRRRDLKAINQDHFVNEDSNYCFGEGGAGTYSDGKLYTRSLKRGDVRRIFENLVYHGATDQILVDAHPHIGTNKLPKVVQNIRETILKYGGEIHFETRVTDFIIKNNEIKAIQFKNGKEITVEEVILATGHSARDIFYLLHEKQIALEAKSFAMGVRVEHPQHIIDSIQYHCSGPRHELLPAASYGLVEQVKDRGQFKCPIVFRGPTGSAGQLGATHSQAFESWFANTPGLKVVVPSNPYDAKGLLKAAIRDDDPVIFMESEQMYGDKGEVPEGEYILPIGVADVKREGTDVTIVSFGKIIKEAYKAADELEKEGISCEIIDLRTVRPMDRKAIVESVKKTNRLVVLEEAWPFGNVATEITYLIQSEAFDYLDAPVVRINTADTPAAYSPVLMEEWLPDYSEVIKAVKKVMYK